MENKDLNLKLMTKILFKEMGFNTHYEIKLRTKSYISTLKTHDVSDIDVFGYCFNADLSYFTIGAECKSGESGALDEFYKFLGIAKYYKLDKAYLVKTKIHQNARQVSINNNFICLSEAEIRRMILGLGINIDKSIKIEYAKIGKFSKYVAAFKLQNEKLIDYIGLDYWNREYWKSIHNILHLLKLPITQQQIYSDTSISTKYVYYYVLELLSYLMLRNISDAIVLSYSDIENAIINCLYGGAEALNEKRRIHDAVNIATQASNKFEPEWQEDFVLICSRWALSTKNASLIPKFIQDLYEDCFFSDAIKMDSKITKRYPDTTRKFIQDIIQFLCRHCDVKEVIFADFMKL